MTKAFYTTPFAFKYCYNMYYSYTDILKAYNVAIFTNYEESLWTYMANFSLNFMNMYYNAYYLYDASQNMDWTNAGVYLSKIFSSYYLKNTLSDSWVYQNSAIMQGSFL